MSYKRFRDSVPRREETPLAVRLNADKPSWLPDAHVQDVLGRPVDFSLLSLPLYLVGQLSRLVRDVLAAPPSRPIRP